MARKPVFKTTPTDEVQPLVETSPFQAPKPSKKRINEASLVRQRNETNGLTLIFFIHSSQTRGDAQDNRTHKRAKSAPLSEAERVMPAVSQLTPSQKRTPQRRPARPRRPAPFSSLAAVPVQNIYGAVLTKENGLL